MKTAAYAVLGVGRVGSALSRSLTQAGIAHRRFHRAGFSRGLASLRHPRAVFLCIPEAALLERRDELAERALPYVIVSGSLQPDALQLPRVTTFHPLMGFSAAGPKTLAGIPVGVDSPALATLARKLQARPFVLPADRALYHAAAVLGGAGVLTAWTEACALLAASGVTGARDVLLPIALAALQRQVLTGPVVRGDDAAIVAHRRAITRKSPQVLAVYDALIAAMRR